MWVLSLTLSDLWLCCPACRSLRPCMAKFLPALWTWRWMPSLRRTWTQFWMRSEVSMRASLTRTAVTWRPGTRSRWEEQDNTFNLMELCHLMPSFIWTDYQIALETFWEFSWLISRLPVWRAEQAGGIQHRDPSDLPKRDLRAQEDPAGPSDWAAVAAQPGNSEPTYTDCTCILEGATFLYLPRCFFSFLCRNLPWRAS